MKLNLTLTTIFITGLACVEIHAQSCCSKTLATEEFNRFGSSTAFINQHETPLAFKYSSYAGNMIKFKTSDGKDGNAFVIRTEKTSNKFVLVLHEWWGLNDYIKREAEKLYNELGDVNVIALDLYDGKVATVADSASKYMTETKTERCETLVRGIIEYMGKNVEIATIGWCFGGGWSLQSAIMAAEKSQACVMYYGMPEKDISKLKHLHANVLGIFASKDKWITKEIVTNFEKNMKQLNKTITIKFFDADHAFANPSNPHFDKLYSEEAHTLVIDFLKKNL